MVGTVVDPAVDTIRWSSIALITCIDRRMVGEGEYLQSPTWPNAIGHFHSNGQLIVVLKQPWTVDAIGTDGNGVGHMHLVACNDSMHWCSRSTSALLIFVI